ncbi:cell division protein FtsZ [Scandinavium goeteborgense]|uniref:cell division protein FtsZ n=1 Tax=Scandinavium goeteborgense TaxID=1851514 RepID=UPI000F66C28F|nr:cell division protein FtsZ [Scandinavium goeteborgense]QKN82222.1 cell division protein FtsZ [Scandinavium goeteborgense]
MKGQHYGTDLKPRGEILPGTLVKHNGRTYRASANVTRGLYISSLIERALICSETVEVLLNGNGQPLIN